MLLSSIKNSWSNQYALRELLWKNINLVFLESLDFSQGNQVSLIRLASPKVKF